MLSQYSNVKFFMPPDPLRPQGYQDTLSSKKPDNDPDKPPAKEPGDSYIIISAIIGGIVGGLLAFILTFWFFNAVIVWLCVAGGVIAGGIAGTYIGDALEKRKLKRNQ
jgi:hypothetical protein